MPCVDLRVIPHISKLFYISSLWYMNTHQLFKVSPHGTSSMFFAIFSMQLQITKYICHRKCSKVVIQLIVAPKQHLTKSQMTHGMISTVFHMANISFTYNSTGQWHSACTNSAQITGPQTSNSQGLWYEIWLPLKLQFLNSIPQLIWVDRCIYNYLRLTNVPCLIKLLFNIFTPHTYKGKVCNQTSCWSI